MRLRAGRALSAGRGAGVKGRDGTHATPELLATEMAFAPAAEMATRLLGFAVNAKWMERMAKRVGVEMAAADAEEHGEAAAPSEAMCCGIDGTGVPVRPGREPTLGVAAELHQRRRPSGMSAPSAPRVREQGVGWRTEMML